MGIHQFLLVAAFILALIATITSWEWRQGWPTGYGHTAGWAGLACFFLAAIV